MWPIITRTGFTMHWQKIRRIDAASSAAHLGDHPKPASRDHPKTGQLQTSNQDKIVVPYLESSSKFFPILLSRGFSRFGSPAFRATLQDVSMMEEAIEDGGDRSHVA